MLDLNKAFNTDKDLEENGKWEPIGGGAKLLVARAGSTRYQKEFTKIPLGIRTQLENGSLHQDESLMAITELLSKTILLGWEGLADDGKELPYSTANAQMMLFKYRGLRDMVWNLASNAQRFHREAVEEELGNS